MEEEGYWPEVIHTLYMYMYLSPAWEWGMGTRISTTSSFCSVRVNIHTCTTQEMLCHKELLHVAHDRESLSPLAETYITVGSLISSLEMWYCMESRQLPYQMTLRFPPKVVRFTHSKQLMPSNTNSKNSPQYVLGWLCLSCTTLTWCIVYWTIKTERLYWYYFNNYGYTLISLLIASPLTMIDWLCLRDFISR